MSTAGGTTNGEGERGGAGGSAMLSAAIGTMRGDGRGILDEVVGTTRGVEGAEVGCGGDVCEDVSEASLGIGACGEREPSIGEDTGRADDVSRNGFTGRADDVSRNGFTGRADDVSRNGFSARNGWDGRSWSLLAGASTILGRDIDSPLPPCRALNDRLRDRLRGVAGSSGVNGDACMHAGSSGGGGCPERGGALGAKGGSR